METLQSFIVSYNFAHNGP